MDKEELMKMAESLAATSYRNRADTSNPAFGFNAQQLADFASAILERAAVECEDQSSEKHGMHCYEYARAIRALKPSNNA